MVYFYEGESILLWGLIKFWSSVQLTLIFLTDVLYHVVLPKMWEADMASNCDL